MNYIFASCSLAMSLFKTYSIKFTVLLLAVQILNLSVYGSEYYQTVVLKNKQVKQEMNQIDSMVEYIVEVTLKHYDAFPEQKGNHTKNESKNFKYQLHIFSDYKPVADEPSELFARIEHLSSYKNQYDYLFTEEINPPPPKTDFSFM